MTEQARDADLCQPCWKNLPPITIDNVREFIAGVAPEVPLADGRHARYVNFDNAATTPPFLPILDHAREFFDCYASIHRGSGFKSFLSSRIFDRCRQVVADFIGADLSHDTLIFTQNATHSLNKLAAHVLTPGEHVVLTTVMEHHSNMLPWHKDGVHIEYAGIERAGGELDLADLESKIKAHAGRLRLVTVTGASNVTGVIPPFRQIARMAHEHGAMIALDASQLIPHRPFKMGAPGDPERIDFVAFSGHKMFAPFGAGVLVGPRTAFEGAAPDMTGGGTVCGVTTDDVLWAGLPEKEEAGTPNAFGVFAMGYAVKVLDTIGMDNVEQHEQLLVRRALDKLTRMEGIEIYGPKDPAMAQDRVGVIALNMANIGHAHLAAALGHEWGIGVRSGCFCAQPYVRELLDISDEEMSDAMVSLMAGDHVSVPGMVRISFGIYNTADEVDYLVEALDGLLRHGPKQQYAVDHEHSDLVPTPPTVDVKEYLPM